MTISQWKSFGAAALACILAMGDLQAFAQLGGSDATEKAPATAPADNDDRQAALQRSVAKLQAELDESNQRNARLQTQLRIIQAELKALRATHSQSSAENPNPRTGIETKPPQAPILGNRKSAEGQGGGIQGNKNSLKYKQFTQEGAVLIVPPLGGKVKVYNTRTHKTQSFQLSSSKELPLDVTPYSGPGVTALYVRGQNITAIAAAQSFLAPWVVQELREPVSGDAYPIVGPNVALYILGRHLYGFSPEKGRWDVVEMHNETKSNPIVGPLRATLENDGHVYTFDAATGKWSDVDLRAISEAPDDADPANAASPPTSTPSQP